MKIAGIINKGKINSDIGKLNILIIKAKIISEITIKIITIAKNLDTSVKIAPLNKNSCNLDKYLSGTILSTTDASSFTILNFIK